MASGRERTHCAAPRSCECDAASPAVQHGASKARRVLRNASRTSELSALIVAKLTGLAAGAGSAGGLAEVQATRHSSGYS